MDASIIKTTLFIAPKSSILLLYSSDINCDTSVFSTHLKPTGITPSRSSQLSLSPHASYYISRHKHYEELTKKDFPLHETSNTQKEVSRAWEINITRRGTNRASTDGLRENTAKLRSQYQQQSDSCSEH